ncbi:hypothetical protein LshimejAT787_0104970 [Lyophyllum shimeji]|uniref:Uncharacterized protein n=1 Tax=Lyophyllum shimeji TaxID=47721 RepID=A0A9P3PD47_LYOSH|nr:hypothetical protein LshimejAT787_0104970 [Lyophyllum shimeji]
MSLETTELQFVIDLEEDEVKAGELSEESPDPISPQDQVLREVEKSNSYFSAEFSVIQPLDDCRSLLVLAVRCHPATKRRFVNATITWKFTATATKANVTHLAPEFSVGGWSEECTKLVWGITLPIQAGLAGSSVGLEASRSRESHKGVMHAMTIVGTRRNAGARCVWTVEENSSSARGIPSHFQLAVVIQHEGPFLTELDVKAELGGCSWFGPRFMRAKKGREGAGLRRTIDIETSRCGDVLWESGEEGWKKFMKEMTGEVGGATLDFGQAIVRP